MHFRFRLYFTAPVALVEVLSHTPPPLQSPAAAAVVTPPAGVGMCLRLPGQLLVPAELEHVRGPGLPGAPLGQGGPQLVVVV